MSIFNTIDRTLRAKGILDEGYNPQRDAYEYTLFGLPFKRIKFSKVVVDHIHDSFAQRAAEVKEPRPFYAKKKYEVILPKGEVRRYRSAEHLMRDVINLRGNLTRYQGLNNVGKEFILRRQVQGDKMGQRLRAMTGCCPSQLACAPDAVITIRNLRTNKVLMRPVSNLFKISEGFTQAVA